MLEGANILPGVVITHQARPSAGMSFVEYVNDQCNGSKVITWRQHTNTIIRTVHDFVCKPLDDAMKGRLT